MPRSGASRLYGFDGHTKGAGRDARAPSCEDRFPGNPLARAERPEDVGPCQLSEKSALLFKAVGTLGEMSAHKLTGSAHGEKCDLRFFSPAHTKSGPRHTVCAEAAKTCAPFSPAVPSARFFVRPHRRTCRRCRFACAPTAACAEAAKTCAYFSPPASRAFRKLA